MRWLLRSIVVGALCTASGRLAAQDGSLPPPSGIGAIGSVLAFDDDDRSRPIALRAAVVHGQRTYSSIDDDGAAETIEVAAISSDARAVLRWDGDSLSVLGLDGVAPTIRTTHSIPHIVHAAVACLPGDKSYVWTPTSFDYLVAIGRGSGEFVMYRMGASVVIRLPSRGSIASARIATGTSALLGLASGDLLAVESTGCSRIGTLDSVCLIALDEQNLFVTDSVRRGVRSADVGPRRRRTIRFAPIPVVLRAISPSKLLRTGGAALAALPLVGSDEQALASAAAWQRRLRSTATLGRAERTEAERLFLLLLFDRFKDTKFTSILGEEGLMPLEKTATGKEMIKRAEARGEARGAARVLRGAFEASVRDRFGRYPRPLAAKLKAIDDPGRLTALIVQVSRAESLDDVASLLG